MAYRESCQASIISQEGHGVSPRRMEVSMKPQGRRFCLYSWISKTENGAIDQRETAPVDSRHAHLANHNRHFSQVTRPCKISGIDAGFRIGSFAPQTAISPTGRHPLKLNTDSMKWKWRCAWKKITPTKTFRKRS